MRSASLFASLAATLALAAPAVAQERPLDVQIDQATRVQLRAPAGSVIVANPRIADVTVTDARTLFITGKSYGLTEIIAVDALGRPLFQRQVAVSPGETGSVRVWRGGEVVEVACGARCAPAARPSTAP
ncbi:Similar to secretin RcpA/CpaC, associated with Flp pilus assembly [Brevundimonas diminuta 3F5N]|uniref:Similar to secretin RcpA/CpaC, associated with Flp pilus assembly n=1 Tax=Brevundimonas diminuta 3F5N TaxID=1255603 RepID=A0A1R4G2F7_BREDI|nr:pilus assembly protein N-terminal domain-containing protein [Brevundimonas diminuta]SJM62369.1 Similar to secretin RcpA/CpaC, associated with Flp pilus assembly [Brevundimonas diminuta 3F5N]